MNEDQERIITEYLKEKYGRNPKKRAKLNRALRDEVYGGEETVELLELLHGMLSRCRDAEEKGKIETAMQGVENIRLKMLEGWAEEILEENEKHDNTHDQ